MQDDEAYLLWDMKLVDEGGPTRRRKFSKT